MLVLMRREKRTIKHFTITEEDLPFRPQLIQLFQSTAETVALVQERAYELSGTLEERKEMSKK